MAVTAADLDHLLDRKPPVATVVAVAPDASEGSDEQRRLHAKELRSGLESADVPEDLAGRIAAVFERGAESDWKPGEWLGVVADADDVTVVPLVDGRDELSSVGSLPRFVPFVRDAFEHRRHLVVVCDRVGASIARVTRGEIQRQREVHGDEQHVQKVSSGGFSQRRMQAHTDHTWEQNAKEVVEVVRNEAEAIAADLIVVTGDERAVQLVRKHLPERWQDRLAVDDLQPADADDEAYVFDRAETLVRDQAASEVVDLLQRFAEARGQGEAADGTDEVLDALRRGAVDVLLVAGDVDDEAYFAVDDPRQAATDRAVLEALGLDDARTGRLSDVAVRAAFAGDAGVVVCPTHGPDTPSGPLGALLRF